MEAVGKTKLHSRSPYSCKQKCLRVHGAMGGNLWQRQAVVVVEMVRVWQVAGRQITTMHHVTKIKDVYSNSKLILQLSGGKNRQSSVSLEIAWSSYAQ